MFGIIFVVLGAVWRFNDGLSSKVFGIPTGVRNVGTFAISFAACLYAFDFEISYRTFWLLLPSGIATATIVIGRTKWQSLSWQLMRFGLPALLATVPLVYFGVADLSALLYAVACAIGGASYTLLEKIDAKLPRFGVVDGKEDGPYLLFDGFEAYARLFLGGFVMGGLAFIPF